MKKILSCLLVLCLVLSSLLVPALAEGKELVVGLSYDFGDISPFGIVSMGRGYACYEYEKLARPLVTAGDSWEEMYWELAKNIEKVDDYTYNVEIYDCIYDTAGNHITASDVAFCYTTQLAKANDETITNYLESCTATGDYTVQFKLSGLGLNTIEYILYQVMIVSQAAYEASGNGMANAPIATGPYYVDSFIAGSEIVYVRNENYWRTALGTELPEHLSQYWDKVTIKCITESSQMTIALQDGTIDVACFVDNASLVNFLDADNNPLDGYVSYSMINSAFTCLLYNCDEQSPMSDVNLRKAVSYAIKAEDIVKMAIDGKGGVEKAFSNPRYSDYQQVWDEEDYFGQDLELAKSYLEKSSYAGQTIRIAYETSEVKQKIAQVIMAYLSQIGINCEIIAYDTALFNSYKYDPAQWDILIDQKGSANGFGTFPLQLCFAPGAFELGTANFIQNDETLITLYNLNNDPATHSDETVQAMENHLRENAYVYSLYYTYNYCVANSAKVTDLCFLTGANFNPFGCR